MRRWFLVKLLSLFLVVTLPACNGARRENDDPTVSPTRGKGDGPGSEVTTTNELTSVFLPYDDPLPLELAAIRRVVAARQSDGNSYPPGENPYAIHYAVYNLRNPDITDALIAARKAGVHVQIVIDADQLDPARDWNTMDERLVEAGFTLVADATQLDDVTRTSDAVIGVRSAGLMHLKTRLFRYRDPATGQTVEELLTGSMNPGDLALFNDETLYHIRDRALIALYRQKYEAVRDGLRLTNRWDENAPINVLFSPDGGVQARDKLIEWIRDEKEAIFLAVYALREVTDKSRRSLVQSLIEARARGVLVIVATDHKHVDGVDVDGNRLYPDDPIEDELRAGGIIVYECTNASTPFNAMHMKLGIFGLTRVRVVTDAGNWTKAALGSGGSQPKNHESVLFIDSAKLDENGTGYAHIAAFLRVVESYHLQQPNTGEPRFDALFGQLRDDARWPKIKLHLRGIGTTEYGQSFVVTGNVEALGSWDPSRGLALTTDETLYPTWDAETEVELPLGDRIELKLVKLAGDRSTVAWQSGENVVLRLGLLRSDDSRLTLARRASIFDATVRF